MKLRQAYLPKFREVLPGMKVVRYCRIENEIHAVLMYELGANIPLVKAAQEWPEREDAMMRLFRLTKMLWFFAFAAFTLVGSNPAWAASAAEINRDANRALQNLYKKSSAAKALSAEAKAILVFPGITKGGFMVGGQYGEGALMKEGKTIAYYNTVSVSYGLQVGIQTYGYALFLMTDSALAYLDRSDGWELGSGPSIVIMDEGKAGGISTTTARSDVYAFFFSQKGLMGGLGLQGTKITRIKK